MGRGLFFVYLFLCAHCEVECAAFHQLLMGEFPVGYLLAVEFNALDINGFVGLAGCVDDQILSVGHVQYCFLEERCANDVLGRTCGEGVEAQ